MIEIKKDTLRLSLSQVEDQFLYGDVLDCLRAIPDNCVHVVFTSPPYNVEIDYGNRKDSQPWKDYLNWLFEIWKECARVLVSGGRLVVNIDAITNRQDPDISGEYLRPIFAELIYQMRQIPGMMFRAEICWLKHQVVGRTTAWGSHMSCSNPVVRRNHEGIFIWSKGTWKLEGDSELSDMAGQEFEEWTLSTWDITPETRNMGEHPVPFPEELSRRVIKLYSYRGNVILDPFCGSGTTCAVAAAEGRKYIGIDNYLPYIQFAEKRTKAAALNASLIVPSRKDRILETRKNKSQKESEEEAKKPKKLKTRAMVE